MNRDHIQNLRENYVKGSLERSELLADPLELFRNWFEEARNAKIMEPNAMILSTVNADSIPSSRTVLLKDISDEGLVFYTNFESGKGKDIAINPNVSVVFLWKEMERQVRIKGVAEKVSEETATKYFQSRPKDSQIGAWASAQSQVLPDRSPLELRADQLSEEYKDVDVLPKPPFWGGYLIRPTVIEFWQGRRSRLHDRFRFTKQGNEWLIDRLSP